MFLSVSFPSLPWTVKFDRDSKNDKHWRVVHGCKSFCLWVDHGSKYLFNGWHLKLALRAGQVDTSRKLCSRQDTRNQKKDRHVEHADRQTVLVSVFHSFLCSVCCRVYEERLVFILNGRETIHWPQKNRTEVSAPHTLSANRLLGSYRIKSYRIKSYRIKKRNILCIVVGCHARILHMNGASSWKNALHHFSVDLSLCKSQNQYLMNLVHAC